MTISAFQAADEDAQASKPVSLQRRWSSVDELFPTQLSCHFVPVSGAGSHLHPAAEIMDMASVQLEHLTAFPQTKDQQQPGGGRTKGHTYTYTYRIVMCEYCEESFSRPWNLKVHLRRKHGIGQELKCSKCGAKFRSKVRLRVHAQACNKT